MTVYYIAPDLTAPTGGVKVQYQHVDLLNEAGWDAKILHTKPGFRVNWFENKTMVEYLRVPFKNRFLSRLGISHLQHPVEFNGEFCNDFKVKSDDILVYPEYLALSIPKSFLGIKKVIFAQAPYWVFRENQMFANESLLKCYKHPDVLGILTGSEDSKSYLEVAFPGVVVGNIRNKIDSNVFFSNDKPKKKQFAYIKGKNPEVSFQCIEIMKNRGYFEKYDLVEIKNFSEAQIAATLRESLFFLNFSFPEGFNLPMAEAMISGAIVIGFHANGGREFLTKDYAFPVECWNIIEFMAQVEHAINLDINSPEILHKMRQSGASYIRERYTIDGQRKDLMSFWEKYLA